MTPDFDSVESAERWFQRNAERLVTQDPDEDADDYADRLHNHHVLQIGAAILEAQRRADPYIKPYVFGSRQRAEDDTDDWY